MSYPEPFSAKTECERDTVERARAAATIAAQHADRHDREGSLPLEGLEALARSGYLGLVVPEAWGGQGARVTEMVLGNLELARGDASLGLVVAMHAALLGRVRDGGLWPSGLFEDVAREVAASRDGKGALINSLATEPELGSPSRGGLPSTTAERHFSGWRLNGRKSFCTGASALRWGVVSANTSGRLTSFLVPLDSPGVRVEETWDTLGMRATGSHTIVLENVEVSADAEVPRSDASGGGGDLPHEHAWSLTVAAVYLGIAEAARDYTVHYARTRKPTALHGKSIASVPQIRQRAGHIDLLLYQARAAVVQAARDWDAQPSAGVEAALAMVKVVNSNLAVQVAEEAMRLVGGSSMDRGAPLERHFRDVRAGLHHPPQEDAALELFARQALD